MRVASGVTITVPIILFETVTKEFTPESYGVRDVSFSVDPGEMIFITGHSGSGKTTLMKLLTREYIPTEGEIYFQDEPLSDYSKQSVHNLRRRIGVVFQDYQLVPEMNVWENIALPLYVAGKKEAEIEQRVTDLLNLIKLPEKADQFPSQLSGGEAQRVSIARALAVGPEVIFADEPTGNLDPDTSLAIARLLKKINELGTTIMIATHDQDVLKGHADSRHIVLEKGKIVSDSAAKKSAYKPPKGMKTEAKKPVEIKQDEDSKRKPEPKEKVEDIKVSDQEVEKPKEETEKKSGWGWFGKKNKSEEKPTAEKSEVPKTEEKKVNVDTKKEKDSK